MDTYYTIKKERNKRLLKWSNGEKAPPLKLQFNPTGNCNLNCKFCWRRDTNSENREELSDQEILKLFKEAKKLGIKEWFISGGGEPTFRPIIFKLFKKIKNAGMYGDLITNGTLFNKSQIDMLVKIKWDQILFSLDGANAKTHDYLRGAKGVFDKIIENLNLFKENKKRSKYDRPLIGITTIICNKNFNQIADLIKIAKKYNCEGIYLNPLKNYNSYCKDFKLNKKQSKAFQIYIKQSKKIIKKHNIKNNLDDFIKKNELILKSDDMHEILSRRKHKEEWFGNTPCYEPWYNLVINEYGQVSVCCERIGENFRESINEKSLKNIWFGKHFNDIREMLKKGNLFDKCLKCGAWQIRKTKIIQKILEKGEYNKFKE